MIQRYSTLTILFLAVLCMQGTPSFAQISAQDLHNDRIIEKLVVKHASRMHAQEVLEAALDGDDSSLIPDDNGNSFVVIGSEYSIRVAKEALSKIDQKPEAKPLEKTAVFYMKNVKAGKVLETVQRLFSNYPGFRAAADEHTNALIVEADEKQATKVSELIDLLDKPLSAEKPLVANSSSIDCQLRLSWLVESDSFSESDEKMLRKVRPSLQKLVDRLQADSGASKIVTLTDVQTITGNGEFRNTSSRELNIGSIQVNVAGSATLAGKEKFDLSLSMVFEAAGQQVELESRFTTPSGHPVAFSVSDIGGIRSYLIVEVESAETE